MKNTECEVWWRRVSFFNHLNNFLSSSFSHREEISTLSRQASFRRVNSVSTDARGAVLFINNSFHILFCSILHKPSSVRPDTIWSYCFYTIFFFNSNFTIMNISYSASLVSHLAFKTSCVFLLLSD